MTIGANVVSISRAAAAGGEEIGRAVAARLDLPYVDDEVIRLAAERAGIDPTVVAEAEVPKSLVMRLVDAIDALGATAAQPGAWLARPSQKALRVLIRDTIMTVADRGRAVIVAHAASMALGPRPGVLRVLVTGSSETRIERLVRSGLLNERDAVTAIDDSDRNRRQYLAMFYGVQDESPAHYDLVINTDRVGIDQAVALLVAAIRTLERLRAGLRQRECFAR
jgi:cytidylate kinase